MTLKAAYIKGLGVITIHFSLDAPLFFVVVLDNLYLELSKFFPKLLKRKRLSRVPFRVAMIILNFKYL